MKLKARIFAVRLWFSPINAVLILFLVGCTIWSLDQVMAVGVAQSIVVVTKHTYWGLHQFVWLDFFHDPYFYAAVALIVLCQTYLPARPEQPLISSTLVSDLIWSLITFLSISTIYVAFFAFLYGQIGPFVVVHLSQINLDLPILVEFAIGILLIDFLFWANHLVRHKVKSFWIFHTIHHAQQNINFFTVDRIHRSMPW